MAKGNWNPVKKYNLGLTIEDSDYVYNSSVAKSVENYYVLTSPGIITTNNLEIGNCDICGIRIRIEQLDRYFDMFDNPNRIGMYINPMVCKNSSTCLAKSVEKILRFQDLQKRGQEVHN